MKVYTKMINKGEVFCCSVKDVKSIFNDTAIILNFGALGSRDFKPWHSALNPGYFNKNITGIVIAGLKMCNRQEDPIFSFFVLRQEEWTNELRKEFNEKYLTQLHKFYTEMFNSTSPIYGPEVFKCVELRDKQLILHTVTD